MTGENPDIDLTKLKNYSYEMGPIRPPSEGGAFSLLLRVTRNCPWSKCTFCYARFYRRQHFELRPVKDVKADIDTMKAIAGEIKVIAAKLGFGDKIESLSRQLPSMLLGGKDVRELDSHEAANVHSVINVYNWLATGGKTVFLQDADSVILYTDQLVDVLNYLRQTFPSVERVTSYARAKSLVRKTPGELKQLREAGLARLHVGLETGDDELLAHVNKGVTADEQILAGKKAKAAGFELSMYVMPGLGGSAFWEQHALNTARVLNEINPDFIRMRPLVPMDGTPILEAYQTGELELTSPHERLREIRLMVENLNVTSRITFDQITNTSIKLGNDLIPLFKRDYDGYKLPEEKAAVLEVIDEGLRLDEKALMDVREWAGTTSM